MDKFELMMGGIAALFVVVLFGGIFWDEHEKHEVAQACIASGGEVVQDSCIRRTHDR